MNDREPIPLRGPADARHASARHAVARHAGLSLPVAPVWVALGIGALAGAAGLAYLRQSLQGAPTRPPDSAPGRTARRHRFGDYAVVGRTVTIDRPRDVLYAFWRDFSNLPAFMENVRAVEPGDEGTWRWTIGAPGGAAVTVVTRLVDERENESLSWRSLEGSDGQAQGKITFRDAPGGRGTELEAIIAYIPPAGDLGVLIAKLFRKDPATQGRHELKRFKMLMETGEIATAANRSSNPAGEADARADVAR
jgi:uncharacterized membrane protein